MRVERIGMEEYEAALPSDGFEVFHAPAALSVLDAHAPGDLVLLGGYKGEQAVGLLPVFVRERSVGERRVGRTITSPPPSMGVPRLGPIVMPTSPKRRKRERVNRRFVRGALETLDADAPRTLVRLLCNSRYRDPRPFEWAGLEYDTTFTYRLETDGGGTDSADSDGVDTDSEELLNSFSKSLRREIRDGEDLDVGIDTEGIDGARAVYRSTAARYAEQDEPFGPTWNYVRDLFAALDDRARAYVARGPDGEFLGGITVLYSNDDAYYWQGGARTEFEGVSVNSLLHWAIIEDLSAGSAVEGVTNYDLVGANTERLCKYKAKFGGKLVPYYTVESGGAGMDAAKAAYGLVGRVRERFDR